MTPNAFGLRADPVDVELQRRATISAFGNVCLFLRFPITERRHAAAEEKFAKLLVALVQLL